MLVYKRVNICLLFILPLSSILHPSSVYAAATTWDECVEEMVVNGSLVKVATLQCLEPVFARIVSFAAGGALLAFFVMFVIAAFKYLTSGGDPKQTESARNTMTYAFIGIIVIVGSYIVIRFLEAFTGIPNLGTFSIPTPAP